MGECHVTKGRLAAARTEVVSLDWSTWPTYSMGFADGTFRSGALL